MKKFLILLSVSLLLSSCIVVKVYDSPKQEEQAPKVIAKRRMMMPSDKTITLPTGDQEILFFGDQFPPEPMLFHGSSDTLMIDIKGDSIAHKGIFVIKLDEGDSLTPPMKLKWKGKEGGMFIHPPIPMPMHNDAKMKMPACCAAKDSVCSDMPKIKKEVRIIKSDAAQQDDKQNIFVFRSEEEKGAPLIVIDGEEQPEGYDFKNIAPDDIERIDVVKGPAAIKRFGDKGKNGVVDITMKKN